MERAYLLDGREVVVHKKIDDEIIVSDIYEALFDDEVEHVSSHKYTINKVFQEPPTLKHHKSIEALKTKEGKLITSIGNLTKQINDLQHGYSTLKKLKDDYEKLIFNRSDILKAKRLHIFSEHYAMPIEINLKKDGWISLNISLKNGEIRAWGHEIYVSYDSSGEYFEPKYGIMIDKTDEELKALTIERINSYDPITLKREIQSIPDDYLNEEQKKLKEKSIQESRQKRIDKINKEILSKQTELSKLLAE